ncbi:MAG: PQQ-dependent sugar dehydrogenase [Myxococcota bacterium]
MLRTSPLFTALLLCTGCVQIYGEISSTTYEPDTMGTGGSTDEADPPGTATSDTESAEDDGPVEPDLPSEAPWIEQEIPLDPGWPCEFGGVEIQSGFDDGQGGGTAHDGMLDPAEVEESTLDCLLEPDPALIAGSGLEELPTNRTCAPPSGPSLTEGVTVAPAFTQLQFPANPDCFEGLSDSDCSNAFRPTMMVQHPLSQQWYLTEQNGRVLRFDDDPGATLVEVALDLQPKLHFSYEAGLLNLVFDPANPDYAYVYYIACAAQLDDVCTPDEIWGVVSRFTLDIDGNLDPTSERVIVQAPHGELEHNGNGPAFGNDGLLYIAFGDGGHFPPQMPQDGQSLLGKVLRLQVNDDTGLPLGELDPPYLVPADNPFVGDPAIRDEIYALGLRNPWRMSIDTASPAAGPQTIFLGDVGLVTAEEINEIVAGGNYGWPVMEAEFCRPGKGMESQITVTLGDDCSPELYQAPTYWYRQAFGVSITGGYVYRGTALPSLQGDYIFADFTLGTIWALDLDQPDRPKRFLLDTTLLIPTFARALDNELYTFDWWSGSIYALVPVDSSSSRPADTLSTTGCVDPKDPRHPAPGGLPYGVNTPFFSEQGIYKDRWLYLPPGAGLTEYNQTGNLVLQSGSVLVKNFDVEGQRIETRLMFRHDDGGWSMWSYRWREDQTDADLVTEALQTEVEGIEWIFPDQGHCLHCHTYPAGRVLGLDVHQLNRLGWYPSTGLWANQIDTLRALDLIDRVVPIDPALPIGGGNSEIVPLPPAVALPTSPAIDDETVPLLERAAAYLDANCSGCHRPAGGARGNFSLQADEILSTCNLPPVVASFDLPGASIVTPGDPENSILYRRLVETDLPYRMHPYRFTVDEAGAALLHDWITLSAPADCP